jgi:hypothetical protein
LQARRAPALCAPQSKEQQLLEQWQYMVEGPGDISFDAEREARDAVARLLAAEVGGGAGLAPHLP